METTMRLTTIFLMLALALAPGALFAHGEAPQAAHGGMMQEAHEMWLELVVRDKDVTLYVLDEAKKPVPSAQVSGTVTVLAGGKAHKVALSPAEGNSLHGELPVGATGRVAATVSLKIDGKAMSARFTPSA